MPGSKSVAARLLVLRHLTGAHDEPAGLPPGDDTRVMVGALRSLPRGHVDAGRAGTVLRFLLPLAAAGGRPVTFTADAQLAARPLAGLLGALRALGARVDGEAPPLTLHPGAQRLRVLEVDARASSQVVSGLLLAAPALPHGLEVRWRDAPSAGHIALTLDCLRLCGATVQAGDGWARVAPGGLRAPSLPVEPDLPALAPFLLATAVLGGELAVTGVPVAPLQRSPELEAVLAAWGCRWEGPGRLGAPGAAEAGLDLDLRGHAELLPVVAAAAALAAGPSHLTGLAHARGHECDRVRAMAANLGAIGADVTETFDALVIRPRATRPAVWATHDDHRLVMAGAVAALGTPGLVLDDGRAVSKTYPRFLDDWRAMLEQGQA